MHRAVLVLLSLLIPSIVGCSPAGQTRPAADFTRREPTAAAPGFRVPTLDGGTFELAQQRGRVVGLFFMAAWCATCLPEAKAWDNLSRELTGRGLSVLIVSADPGDTPAELRQFRQAAGGGEVAWALDPNGTIVRPYGVTSLDTTIMIDREGRVAYRDSIVTPYERLKQELEKLL